MPLEYTAVGNGRGCLRIGLLVPILALIVIGSSSGQTRLDQTVSASGTQAGPATASMSFAQVVQYALDHNAGIAASRTGVDVARAGKEIARKQRYPVLAAGGGFFANSFAQPIVCCGSSGMFTDPHLSTSFLTYAGDLTLPIYTGGRIASQIRVGEVATQIADLQLRQTRDDLTLNLASAYYGILRFQRIVEARQQSVAALTEDERITSQLVQVGRAPKVDLLRVQTRLANVRQQLIEAQNALSVTYYVLNAFMGISDISFRVIPTETLKFSPLPVDLPASVQQALSRRPLVLQREQEVRLGDAQLSLARAQLRPNLGFRGIWYGGGTSLSGKTPGPFLPVGTRQQNDWGAQVLISVPIFNRSLKEQEHQAALSLSRSRSELEDSRVSVSREVETAYENLESAATRVQAAETALASAQESLRIETLLLNVGKGITSDLLLAQADALQAEENHISALADYEVAQVALERSIGQISVP
jgi:outer membrane protein